MPPTKKTSANYVALGYIYVHMYNIGVCVCVCITKH